MATSHPGTLHVLPKNISAFEPLKSHSPTTPPANTLLWIGGMFDYPGQTTYPFLLAQTLPPTWSLMTCSLTSAGLGWGVKSLQTDVQDMLAIVRFIRERRGGGGKVVIMGHSTGCQDCMEFIVGPGAEEVRVKMVDGVILQAPVSDREALEKALPKAFKDEADQLALRMCREGKEADCLPNRLTRPVFGRLAISARRWVDVSSPGPDHPGADDYFSSDLSLERLRTTFGKIPPSTPLLVLYSGAEENVSENLDKEALVKKWAEVVKEGGGVVDEENGSIVLGATHDLQKDNEKVRQDLVRRVLGFIGRIEGEGKEAKPDLS